MMSATREIVNSLSIKDLLKMEKFYRSAVGGKLWLRSHLDRRLSKSLLSIEDLPQVFCKWNNSSVNGTTIHKSLLNMEKFTGLR